MLHVFQRLAKWLSAPQEFQEPDILAHPLLERMTERELADLPLRADPEERTAGAARRMMEGDCRSPTGASCR